MTTILMALVAGIIIGPLARLVLPGKQNLSPIMTVLLGAVGALAGSAIFRAISGRSDTAGIDWIALLIGVGVAALAIVGYSAVTGKNQARPALCSAQAGFALLRPVSSPRISRPKSGLNCAKVGIRRGEPSHDRWTSGARQVKRGGPAGPSAGCARR